MPVPRLTRQVPLSTVLIGTLLIGIPFHLRPDNFIVDDGYFYPQIARYIANGSGSTFNGITLTNGYHPLWMVVCIAAALVTTRSAHLIQILTVVQDVLLLGCIATVVGMGRVTKLRGATFGCLPLVFFGMVLGIWRLLEANLALALQLAVLVLVVPVFPKIEERLGRWKEPLTGVLLGLTMLARLDLVFFAFTILIYELLCKPCAPKLSHRFSAWFTQATIAAVVLLPYLAWNWRTFHHLLPISGAIKSTFPHIQHLGISSFMYPVVAAILLNLSQLRKSTLSNFDIVCVLTAVAAALHMAYTVSFGGMAPWYLTTGYLSLSLCMIWVADSVLRHVPTIAWAEPVGLSLLFVAFLSLATLRLFSNFTYTRLLHGQVSFRGDYLEPKRALAKKLKETLAPNTRIMIFDAPGGVAFYSGMSVLPVDGLVSDYAYNEDIVRETFAGYAAKEHIDYIVAPYVRTGQQYDRLFMKTTATSAGWEIEILAPLTKQVAGHITTTHDDLLFRFAQINPDLELDFPEVGVWCIPHHLITK
jgi:hypothetical protein